MPLVPVPGLETGHHADSPRSASIIDHRSGVHAQAVPAAMASCPQPPRAHGPPAPPASPLFCKPLCKTGGPMGTGWHRVGTQRLDSPHPTRRPTGSQVPGWGASLATFPPPLSLGVPRVAPHSTGAAPILPLPCPSTQPGEEGSGGSQPSTPAGFGGVLAPQGLLLVLLQLCKGGGTGRPPQLIQLLAVRLQYQLRQPCEGLWERSGVNLGEPSSTPQPLQGNSSPPRIHPPRPLPPQAPHTSFMLRLLQALVS